MAPRCESEDEPEIYGLKKGAGGLVLNRRSFLGAIAASGVLAACGSAEAAQGKNTPATATLPKAHEGEIDGLFMKDKLLFSWDRSTLKAWDFTKGTLEKAVTKDMLKEDLKENALFPKLFTHLRENGLKAVGPGGTTLALLRMNEIKVYKSAASGPDTEMSLKGAVRLVRSLAFAPDGTRLAAGGEDGSITLWNLRDSKVQQLQTGAGAVISLALHPNGALALSGHRDGKVRMWQLPKGRTLTTYNADLSSFVWHLKISPNGALAVTSCADGIKLWGLPDGEPKGALVLLPQTEQTTSMDISADSSILATGTTHGHIYLWRLTDGARPGCLFDPALTPEGTQIAQYRQMGGAVCTCDTIAVLAGFAGTGGVCACNTVAVGSKAAPGCSCVGHVSRPPSGGGGSHYWRPN
jgi:WD40 repeat protein